MRPTRTSSWPEASIGIGKWLLRAVVDELHAGRLRHDARGPGPRVIGLSHSKVMASQCARSTGTRMQVTPIAIFVVVEDLAGLLDDLGLFVVVAGVRDRRPCCG